MKDVEKFDKFEEMKKSEKNKKKISENNQEMVEEFIQLLIKNTRTDENSLRFTKA
jgi:Na+/phosphate symporter